MKVISKNPILINGKKINDKEGYLNVDGTSKTELILAFQKFANLKGVSPQLTESGKWDPMTETASKTYGKEFDKSVKWDNAKGWIIKGGEIGKATGLFDYAKQKLGIGQQTSTPDFSASVTTPGGPTITVETEEELKKKEEELKKKRTRRIILISVGVVAVGTLIYFMTRKKANK
jgi:hypothetical protein